MSMPRKTKEEKQEDPFLPFDLPEAAPDQSPLAEEHSLSLHTIKNELQDYFNRQEYEKLIQKVNELLKITSIIQKQKDQKLIIATLYYYYTLAHYSTNPPMNPEIIKIFQLAEQKTTDAKNQAKIDFPNDPNIESKHPTAAYQIVKAIVTDPLMSIVNTQHNTPHNQQYFLNRIDELLYIFQKSERKDLKATFELYLHAVYLTFMLNHPYFMEKFVQIIQLIDPYANELTKGDSELSRCFIDEMQSDVFNKLLGDNEHSMVLKNGWKLIEALIPLASRVNINEYAIIKILERLNKVSKSICYEIYLIQEGLKKFDNDNIIKFTHCLIQLYAKKAHCNLDLIMLAAYTEVSIRLKNNDNNTANKLMSWMVKYAPSLAYLEANIYTLLPITQGSDEEIQFIKIKKHIRTFFLKNTESKEFSSDPLPESLPSIEAPDDMVKDNYLMFRKNITTLRDKIAAIHLNHTPLADENKLSEIETLSSIEPDKAIKKINILRSVIQAQINTIKNQKEKVRNDLSKITAMETKVGDLGREKKEDPYYQIIITELETTQSLFEIKLNEIKNIEETHKRTYEKIKVNLEKSEALAKHTFQLKAEKAELEKTVYKIYSEIKLDIDRLKANEQSVSSFIEHMTHLKKSIHQLSKKRLNESKKIFIQLQERQKTSNNLALKLPEKLNFLNETIQKQEQYSFKTDMSIKNDIQVFSNLAETHSEKLNEGIATAYRHMQEIQDDINEIEAIEKHIKEKLSLSRKCLDSSIEEASHINKNAEEIKLETSFIMAYPDEAEKKAQEIEKNAIEHFHQLAKHFEQGNDSIKKIEIEQKTFLNERNSGKKAIMLPALKPAETALHEAKKKVEEIKKEAKNISELANKARKAIKQETPLLPLKSADSEKKSDVIESTLSDSIEKDLQLEMKNSSKHLPDSFSIDEIKSLMTPAKEMALHKIKKLYDDLKAEGIPFFVRGSFVLQCVMHLLETPHIYANDIDGIIEITDDKLEIFRTIMASHQFNLKEADAAHSNSSLGFIFEHGKKGDKDYYSIDITATRPGYQSTNSFPLTGLTMEFAESKPEENIKFKFTKLNNKQQIEYYIINKIFPLLLPDPNDRFTKSYFPRFLKWRKKGKLKPYFLDKEQKELKKLSNEIWNSALFHYFKVKFSDLFNPKAGLDCYGNLRRIIKERNFNRDEAKPIIFNFCLALIHRTMALKKMRYDTHISITKSSPIPKPFILSPDQIQSTAEKMQQVLQDFYKKYPYKRYPQLTAEFMQITNDLLQYIIDQSFSKTTAFFIQHLEQQFVMPSKVQEAKSFSYKPAPPYVQKNAPLQHPSPHFSRKSSLFFSSYSGKLPCYSQQNRSPSNGEIKKSLPTRYVPFIQGVKYREKSKEAPPSSPPPLPPSNESTDIHHSDATPILVRKIQT